MHLWMGETLCGGQEGAREWAQGSGVALGEEPWARLLPSLLLLLLQLHRQRLLRRRLPQQQQRLRRLFQR